MWSTLKAIPVLPKILLGSLLLLVVFGLTHRHHYQSESYNFEQYTPATAHPTAYHSQGAPGSTTESGSSEAELASQYLAYFKAQDAELYSKAQACMEQSNQAAYQTNMAMMQGQMVNNQPACVQNMAQWTAQKAYLETVIYQLQVDPHATMAQITGIPLGQSSSSEAPSYYRPSGSDNDGGIGAVERYSRQSIRGNSLYNEPDGTQHELPTEPYYYRNQNSGQIIPSNQPNPPNDGRPYEQLTPQE